jgi:DNA-binding CsgD family transcriptional regulator
MQGRDAERTVIRELLLRARRGTGAVIVVDGEPGIGKSALLRDATDEAAELGFSLTRTPRADLSRQRAPVLMCLDDADWLDPVALAALRDLRHLPVISLLARSAPPRRDAGPVFRLLERDGATRLTLAPLDHEAVTALLTEAFGAPPSPDLAVLAREAAGNPGLITELIAGLRDGDATRRLRDLARQRLGGLSRPAGHLLETAAVLGERFRLEDVAEMLGQTPAALLAPVEEAMDAAILAASDQAFLFRHELLRRAIGESIPAPARTALHRQYGELLLDRGESPARAASHLIQGAYPGSRASLALLDKAAASRRSSPRVAADLAVRARELTDPADPAALDRAAAAAETLAAAGRLDEAESIARDMLARPLPSVAEDRLRCALSSVLCASGRPRDASEQAQLVLTGPQRDAGLRDLALSARLQALTALRDKLAAPLATDILAVPGRQGAEVVVPAMVARAAAAWDDGEIGDALELLRDAARREPGISPDARHAQPLLALAAALFDLRRLGEAGVILDAADHPALRGIPAEAALPLIRARTHLAAGRLTDAESGARAALTIAEAAGAYGYAAAARSVLVVIGLRHGDLAAAERHLAARPPASPQFADVYARPETALARAQLTEAREGPAAALDHLRRLRVDTRPGILLGDPAIAAWLTRTALAAGDNDLAATVARVAGVLAATNPGFPALEVAAVHSCGLFRRDPARLERAAIQHPDPWARACAAEDLGVLHRENGDRDRAIRDLKEALGGYRQTGADRDQARVRRRLRRLGIRRAHWATHADGPVTGWESLTETERVVAGFVAEGLTNAQVAARMYLSTHTVAHHLRHAYRKLDITSRVELTRVVVEETALDRGEGVLEDAEALFQQVVADDQRRQEAEHVAERARGQGHQPVGMAVPGHRGGGRGVGLQRPWPGQLEGEHRAAAADIRDDRERGGQLAQPGEHDLADPAGPARQVLGLHRLERAERGRAGDRVAAVGAAETTRVHGVHDLLTAGDRRERQATGDALRGGDQVGHDTLVVAGEPVARPAEPGLDLIRDQQDPVVGAERRQPRQEPVRRHDEPALTLDRLDDHRGRVGLADLGVDQRLHRVQRVGGARGGAARPAQRVGHRHPVDLTGERPEALLVRHVLGGQRHRQVGASVVGVVERHDRGPAGGVPRDLDRVLYRLGARVEQRRPLLVVAGGAAGEFLAHLDVLLVRGHHETGVRERRHLAPHPVDHRGGRVPDRGDRDPGAEVDQRVAVDVQDHAAAGRGREYRHRG